MRSPWPGPRTHPRPHACIGDANGPLRAPGTTPLTAVCCAFAMQKAAAAIQFLPPLLVVSGLDECQPPDLAQHPSQLSTHKNSAVTRQTRRTRRTALRLADQQRQCANAPMPEEPVFAGRHTHEQKCPYSILEPKPLPVLTLAQTTIRSRSLFLFQLTEPSITRNLETTARIRTIYIVVPPHNPPSLKLPACCRLPLPVARPM